MANNSTDIALNTEDDDHREVLINLPEIDIQIMDPNLKDKEVFDYLQMAMSEFSTLTDVIHDSVRDIARGKLSSSIKRSANRAATHIVSMAINRGNYDWSTDLFDVYFLESITNAERLEKAMASRIADVDIEVDSLMAGQSTSRSTMAMGSTGMIVGLAVAGGVGNAFRSMKQRRQANDIKESALRKEVGEIREAAKEILSGVEKDFIDCYDNAAIDLGTSTFTDFWNAYSKSDNRLKNVRSVRDARPDHYRKELSAFVSQYPYLPAYWLELAECVDAIEDRALILKEGRKINPDSQALAFEYLIASIQEDTKKTLDILDEFDDVPECWDSKRIKLSHYALGTTFRKLNDKNGFEFLRHLLQFNLQVEDKNMSGAMTTLESLSTDLKKKGYDLDVEANRLAIGLTLDSESTDRIGELSRIYIKLREDNPSIEWDNFKSAFMDFLFADTLVDFNLLENLFSEVSYALPIWNEHFEIIRLYGQKQPYIDQCKGILANICKCECAIREGEFDIALSYLNTIQNDISSDDLMFVVHLRILSVQLMMGKDYSTSTDIAELFGMVFKQPSLDILTHSWFSDDFPVMYETYKAEILKTLSSSYLKHYTDTLDESVQKTINSHARQLPYDHRVQALKDINSSFSFTVNEALRIDEILSSIDGGKSNILIARDGVYAEDGKGRIYYSSFVGFKNVAKSGWVNDYIKIERAESYIEFPIDGMPDEVIDDICCVISTTASLWQEFSNHKHGSWLAGDPKRMRDIYTICAVRESLRYSKEDEQLKDTSLPPDHDRSDQELPETKAAENSETIAPSCIDEKPRLIEGVVRAISEKELKKYAGVDDEVLEALSKSSGQYFGQTVGMMGCGTVFFGVIAGVLAFFLPSLILLIGAGAALMFVLLLAVGVTRQMKASKVKKSSLNDVYTKGLQPFNGMCKRLEFINRLRKAENQEPLMLPGEMSEVRANLLRKIKAEYIRFSSQAENIDTAEAATLAVESTDYGYGTSEFSSLEAIAAAIGEARQRLE